MDTGDALESAYGDPERRRIDVKYTLDPGRCILRDGVPIATLHKVTDRATGGYTMDPVEMDDFAQLVVDSLNARSILGATDALREASRESS